MASGHSPLSCLIHALGCGSGKHWPKPSWGHASNSRAEITVWYYSNSCSSLSLIKMLINTTKKDHTPKLLLMWGMSFIISEGVGLLSNQGWLCYFLLKEDKELRKRNPEIQEEYLCYTMFCYCLYGTLKCDVKTGHVLISFQRGVLSAIDEMWSSKEQFLLVIWIPLQYRGAYPHQPPWEPSQHPEMSAWVWSIF